MRQNPKNTLFNNENAFILPSSLVRKYGYPAAAFLSLIHREIEQNQGIIFENNRYVPKTKTQLAEEIMISSRALDRYIQQLIKNEVIAVKKLSDIKSNRTNYYTLIYANL